MAGDVTVAVVSGQMNAGTTDTTDFTKSGFGTPKACVVLLSRDLTDNTSVADESRISIGFSDFSGNFCITHQDEDASAKVNCDARKSNTVCYVELNTSGSPFGRGTASTITDGVRLTNTAAFQGGAGFATVIMFGGADLKVSLDSVTTPNDISPPGDTVTVTTNIDQDLVFFIGTDIPGEDNSTSGIQSSFGVAHIDTSDHSTFVNRCIGWASDHNNVAGSPSAVIRTNRCLSPLTETAGADWELSLTAATTTSYTLTEDQATSGAGMEIYALALDLDDRGSKIGSVDSPTGGATWTPSVALGFTPQYVGLGLTDLGLEDNVGTGSDAGPIGISSNAGSGEETCHSWYNEDAAGTINTNNLFRSRVIDLREDDVSGIIQDHSHSSFNNGDWTYTINTENETAGHKWFYWAIEEAAAAGENTEILTATATGVASIQLAVAKTLAVTAVANAGLSRKCFIPLSDTAVGIATIATLRTAFVTATVVATGVVNLARKVKIGLFPIVTGVAALARKVKIALGNTATGIAAIVVNALEGATLLILTATATAIAALQITVKKTLGVVSVGVATLDPIATFRLLLVAVGTGVATLRTVATFRRAFSAVATGIVALGKKPKLGLAATATGIVSINRTIFKTLRSTAEGVAAVVLVAAVFIAIAVAAVGIPAIALKTKRGLNAVGSGVARIQRTVRKTLDAIATGIATLNEERPTPPSRLQRIIIGFFGGPGGGPGR